MTLSHWLLVNVVMKAENAAVWGASTGIVGIFLIAPLRGALKRLRKQMTSVLDSLDPDVPVGLTKQIDDMQAQLHTLNHHVSEHVLKVRQVAEDEGHDA